MINVNLPRGGVRHYQNGVIAASTVKQDQRNISITLSGFKNKQKMFAVAWCVPTNSSMAGYYRTDYYRYGTRMFPYLCARICDISERELKIDQYQLLSYDSYGNIVTASTVELHYIVCEFY